MSEQFNLNLAGCIKNKGVLCIPLPEIVRLFEKYPYLLGKDFKELFSKATVSDKIQEAKVENPNL